MFSCPAVEILFYLVLVGWAALLALVQVQYTLPKIIWIAALNRAGPSSNGCNGICMSVFCFHIHLFYLAQKPDIYRFFWSNLCLIFMRRFRLKMLQECAGIFFPTSSVSHLCDIVKGGQWTLLLKKSIIATFREYMCSVRWRTTVSLSIFLSF